MKETFWIIFIICLVFWVFVYGHHRYVEGYASGFQDQYNRNDVEILSYRDKHTLLKRGSGKTGIPYCVKYATLEGKDYCFGVIYPQVDDQCHAWCS